MFYCKDCAIKNGWPFNAMHMPVTRDGQCQECGREAECVDGSPKLPQIKAQPTPAAPLPVREPKPLDHLWHNNHVQFPRLLAEIMAVCDIDIRPLAESMDLPEADIEELFTRAETSWEQAKQRYCPPDDTEPCENCGGAGYLFPWGDDTDFVCIEKCDACNTFMYDDDAAQHVATKLLKLDAGYAVANMVLPGMLWTDAGSTRFAVMRWAGAGHRLEPVTWNHGVELAKRISRRHKYTCPKCGNDSFAVVVCTDGGTQVEAVCTADSCDWKGDITTLAVSKR